MAEKILEIKILSKAFFNQSGAKLIVLENVNLQIKADDDSGNFNTILAPLGSGKTTLLRIIAGLENADGEIKLNGKTILQPSGEIIYIPENITSFPWLTVRENIELPANLNKNLKMSSKADELIELVGLSGYENFHSSSEPSGFRLRIALARAIACNPKFILLDDVLKKLDGETRLEIIELLGSLSRSKNISFVLATTNISDAITISNKIFLMRKNPGKIINEMDIPPLNDPNISEIITKIKNAIEEVYKSQNMLNSVLISL